MNPEVHMTRAAEAAWRERYGLVTAHQRVAGYGCALPLIERRCRDGWMRACEYDLPHAIADHGRYYRRPGDRWPLLFLGQPYSPLNDAACAVLERVQSLDLFIRI